MLRVESLPEGPVRRQAEADQRMPVHDGREDGPTGTDQISRRSARGVEACLADQRVGMRVWAGEVDHAAASATRSAFFPLNFSNRSTITSQYKGSSSIRNALRPVCCAAISVEPDPPNRSSTFSPTRDENCIARTASSVGFSVKWTIDCGLTFLTCHRSVALFGPKNWWAAPSFHP